MNFKPLELSDKDILTPFFEKWPNGNAENSFANLYLWRIPWTTQYCIEDYVLYLRLQYRDMQSPPVFFPPLPLDRNIDYCRAMNKAIAYFREIGEEFVLKGVTKEIVEYIEFNCRQIFDIQLDRNYSEYVYNVSDLIELPGKKYHKKRNHISGFLNTVTDYSFSLLQPEDVDECKEMYQSWLAKKEPEDIEGIDDESNAVYESLDHMKELGLVGGVVRIDGKIQAFTVGEQLTPNMALIHIEKANAEIRGLYPYINQQFLKHAFSHCQYVNREEDMGIEGLRRAKESYHPVRMIDKYIVKLKPEVQL